MNVNTLRPGTSDAAAQDELLLDAALWRTHQKLVGHWLHGLRGFLNAMSLNLVLLKTRSGGGGDPESDPSQVLRRQLRELDLALTRFFDRSAFEESLEPRADVAAVAQSVRDLVEPLAKRKQVTLDVRTPELTPFVALNAVTLHALLLTLTVDSVDRLPPRTPFTLRVEREASGTVAIELSPVTAADADSFSTALLDAARGNLQRAGGTLRQKAGDQAILTLLLPAASDDAR